MKIKLDLKLFGFLYLAILAMNVFQVLLLGQAVDSATGIIHYLIFSPLITFAKACAVILTAYIIFTVIRDNK